MKETNMLPEQYERIENLLTGITVMTALAIIIILFIAMTIFFKEWEREKNKVRIENDKHIKELIKESKKNERK